ncbi:ATP-dependent helicase, partial [Mordavella massiliensis]|nr:ATP-dependent helicase [Mordavella massiliensis]
YLSMPYVSTQHGVKGESHLSVIFVAADNNNTPNVRMYAFFELWSKLDFSLPEFEALFYSYSKTIKTVEAEIGMKISELSAETHNRNEKNKAILVKYSNQVLDTYKGNILFDELCKDDFLTYLAKPNVGNAKKIFKITKIEGILTAYKLFYVGCSRARKNLIIVVDENRIAQFKDAFIGKVKKIGFSVQ